MFDNSAELRAELESDNDSDTDLDVSSGDLLKFPELPNILTTPATQHVEINKDSDDFSESEEEFYIPLPETLVSLRKQLLGDYKCPSNPPTSPIHHTLTSCQKLSLKHYIAWKQSNGTVQAYKAHAAVLKDTTVFNILSLYNCQKLAVELTELHAHQVDICPNSCIAYAGVYKELKTCPFVKDGKTCGLSGYKPKRKVFLQNKPYAQMMYLPVMATIKVMFANANTSQLL